MMLIDIRMNQIDILILMVVVDDTITMMTAPISSKY